MSEEKSDAVSQREARFALAALSVPASKAEQFASRVRLVRPAQVAVAFLPALVNFGLAAFSLWLIFTGHVDQGQEFWTRMFATLAWTTFALIVLGLVFRMRLFPTALVLQVHQGVQALRQIAASGDSKLTPIRAAAIWTGSGSESTGLTTLGALQRLDRQRASLFLALGLVLVCCGAILVVPALAPQATSVDKAEYLGTAVAALIVGVLALARAVPWLRSFTISIDEQEFHWQRPASVLWRRRVQASWQDTQAFITFRARKDGKSRDMDEIYLLDTTTEALVWRITPKTPASVRQAHERFVRMANEHVPLRDITASLKDLLASPATRSFEYAVTALSGPAPVPPAVRKVLTTPVRESHFLRGYLIVSAILLALLVVAGLLLQFGLIPAGSF